MEQTRLEQPILEQTTRILVLADGHLSVQLEQMIEACELRAEISCTNQLSDAYAELQNYRFDCIVLGLAQLEEAVLSLLHELQAAPIILISNCTDLEALARCREFGVWEVLSDSEVTVEKLRQRLYCVTRIHQAEQQAKFATQRLRQNDQLMLRQNRLIEAQAQQIQQLNLQLSEATRFRDQFLTMMSHELRTPMNSIVGFSQILQREQDQLSLRQADMVQRILSNAKQLLGCIDEILTFAKLESGQFKLQPERINLTHWVGAVVQELQTEATRKHLQLEFEAHLSNSVVATDPACLQQAVLHLVSNAIKFTNAGTVTVTLREAEPNRVQILVRDTGIGIEPDQLEHIFESFRQVDQSLTRSHCGMGLGLALVAALVRQMQGVITVRSKPGHGSEFCLELPRQPQVRNIHQSGAMSLSAPMLSSLNSQKIG